MRTDLTKGEKNMADLNDPTQTPRKHKVIHWNPENDEGNANKTKTVKAYLGGAIILLAAIVIGTGVYFLFVYDKPQTVIGADGQVAGETIDPRRAFESVSYAQGVKENTFRKLQAARQMPTGSHDVLRQMLINVEKEYINADDLMRRSAYARAVSHFTFVDDLIEKFTREVENKKVAQNLYDNFLVRTSNLERAKHLNLEDFEQAFLSASKGNQFLQSGSFTPARQQLEDAKAKLDSVEASINEHIRTNAGLGYRYISQGKSDEAIAAFTSVLEIDPGNEDAIKQLQRARVAEEVYSLLQKAAAQEAESDFEAAQASFEQAFAIDSASAKAQSGISRMKRMIEERDFGYHYDQAIAADDDGLYEEAIEHYQAALNIFPNRTDLETAIEKALSEKHQNDIVSRITRAYDFEREYAWEDSRDLYQELVQIEPDLQEAKDGLLRSGRMIRNILRYKTMVEAAKTEARRADFQLAIRTFDRAMQSKPTYLQLDEETERLRKFLQLQSQPVAVEFISDETTWVSVQGPSQRKPEKISNQTIDLLPGKYFVIGRRKGYQDVRFSLQIRAGVPQAPLTVICESKNNY